MAGSDLTLISESYEEVKFNSFVDNLLIEGKSVDEITDYIISENLFTRMMSRFGAGLKNADKRDRLKTMIKGKAAKFGQDILGSKGGQKVLDVAQKGLRGGQKLAVKGAALLGKDASKVKGSSTFKNVDKLRKGMQDTSALDKKLGDTIEAGNAATSKFRSEKFVNLLASHKQELVGVFDGFKENMLTLNKHINDMFNDLQKIGGVTPNPKKIQNLKNEIRTNIIIPYLQNPTAQAQGSSVVTKQITDAIIDFLNDRSHTKAGTSKAGLRKADQIHHLAV
jgi:hypothetical protein